MIFFMVTISFDLMESGNIIDKASIWLGRGNLLDESSEEFKMFLVLGKPREQKLLATFDKALNILEKI